MLSTSGTLRSAPPPFSCTSCLGARSRGAVQKTNVRPHSTGFDTRYCPVPPVPPGWRLSVRRPSGRLFPVVNVPPGFPRPDWQRPCAQSSRALSSCRGCRGLGRRAAARPRALKPGRAPSRPRRRPGGCRSQRPAAPHCTSREAPRERRALCRRPARMNSASLSAEPWLYEALISAY